MKHALFYAPWILSTLRVLEYRHSKTRPWYLDLRPFNRGRKFFKTKAKAEAERLRQITTLERHGREAVGLSPGELSAIIEARKKLAKHGKTIDDAAKFYLGYLERIRRCNVTVAQLAKEVLDAKRKDGMSATYIADLKKRLAIFCTDFGNRPIAAITVEELDNWLRNVNCGPKSRANYRANIGAIAGSFKSFPAPNMRSDFNYCHWSRHESSWMDTRYNVTVNAWRSSSTNTVNNSSALTMNRLRPDARLQSRSLKNVAIQLVDVRHIYA
jgi:hypothetical protein